MSATLIVFSGLPATGKTTLAKAVASKIGAAYLRVDTIEQVLREEYGSRIDDRGYRTAYAIAADNLQLGTSVVADSCNPISLTRRRWADVANRCGCKIVNIEVTCSDSLEHRRRAETRECDIPGFESPAWHDILEREYEAWTEPHIAVDTARLGKEECLNAILSKLL